MTKTTVKTAIRRGKTLTRKLAEGWRVEAEVSPCVFMYSGYALQLTLTLKDADGEPSAFAHVANRRLPLETAAEADLRRLLDRVTTMPCVRCSTTTFDPATVETNRGGLCEGCFLGSLQAELAKEQEAELRALALRDRQQKAQGMRCRVTAWIHPHAGDDYQLDWYFPERPTNARIHDLVRFEGSVVFDDYETISL